LYKKSTLEASKSNSPSYIWGKNDLIGFNPGVG